MVGEEVNRIKEEETAEDGEVDERDTQEEEEDDEKAHDEEDCGEDKGDPVWEDWQHDTSASGILLGGP